jgi:hypothetical protein
MNEPVFGPCQKCLKTVCSCLIENYEDTQKVAFPAYSINGTTYVFIKNRKWEVIAEEGDEIVLRSKKQG